MARKAKTTSAAEEGLDRALETHVLPADWEEALRLALVQRPQWLLTHVGTISTLAPEDRRGTIAGLLLEYAAGCTPEQAKDGVVARAVECAVMCAGPFGADGFAAAVRTAPPGAVRSAMLRHARVAIGRADASLLFEIAEDEDAQLVLICGGALPPPGTALTMLLRLASRMDAWPHFSAIVVAAARLPFIAGDSVVRLSEHLDVHLRPHHLMATSDARHSLADVFRSVSRLVPPASNGLWGALVALLLDRDVSAVSPSAAAAVLDAMATHEDGTFVIRVAERHCDLLLPCLRALMGNAGTETRPMHGTTARAVGRLLESCACRAVRATSPIERNAAWAVLEALPPDALLAERAVLRLLLDQAVLECAPAEGIRLYSLVLRAARHAQAQDGDGTLWRELQMQWHKQLASANPGVGVLGAAGLVALVEHCAAEIDAPQRPSDMPSSSQAPPEPSFPDGPCAMLFAEMFEGVLNGTSTADGSALVWLAGALAQRACLVTVSDAPSESVHSPTAGPKAQFKFPFSKGAKQPARGTGANHTATSGTVGPCTTGQLPQCILAWLRKRVSRSFEARWVRETSRLPPTVLASSLLAHALDEPAVCVDLCAAPEAVCAVFSLLQALEKAVNSGSLENVDALLGCPVLVPRNGDANSTDWLSTSSTRRLCLWLCALVSAFGDQDDADVREKAVRRLHALHDLLTDPDCGADHDLEVGIRLPEALDRLDAVPAGRHAHVHERERVGLSLFVPRFDDGEAFFSLVRVREQVPLRDRTRGFGKLPEERRLELIERGDGVHLRRGRRCEDLPKVVVDRRVVIDDEDPPVLFDARRHAALLGACGA